MLGDAGKWSWDNVLKPIEEYKANETLPALTGALNQFLRFIKDSLKALGITFDATSEDAKNFFAGILKDALLTVTLIKPITMALQGLEFVFKKLSETAEVGIIWWKLWSNMFKLSVMSATKDGKFNLQDFINFWDSAIAHAISSNSEWEKAWIGIKTTFANVWDGIKQVTKTAINSIIDSINKMIGGLESALNVIVDIINSIEITNPFTGDEIWSPHLRRMNFSRIPKLARGGIVDEATTFIAGEHGKEAVIPLENNTEWLDKMASRVVTMFNATNGLNGNSVTINVPVELNGREIAKATIKDLNNESIRQGYKPILV